MKKHLIDSQLDLAILIALEEVGEYTSLERIVQKNKFFCDRWKQDNTEKQEVTRIRGRLSRLSRDGSVVIKKNDGKTSYLINSHREPREIIGECLRSLFEEVPISFIGEDVLFHYENENWKSLIYKFEEISEIIFKYKLDKYV